MQFFAFLGVYVLFLATLSPPHPITFSHRWTFGFPRCCLCQIVVLLAWVTVPAWELHLRYLGSRLGHCCPMRGFRSVFTLNFEMCLKCFIKPLSTKWVLPDAASLPALLLCWDFYSFVYCSLWKAWLFILYVVRLELFPFQWHKSASWLTFLDRLVKLSQDSKPSLEQNWMWHFLFQLLPQV